MPVSKTSVGRYLVDRLAQVGVGHVFGVAGDYVLDLMDEIVASPLKLVTSCNELNAGYAADGYARVKGIGALVVTYGVGGLSAMNAVAGAYAERVPIAVISGAPHMRFSREHALMHHVIGHYEMQRKMFKDISACAVWLHDARSAPSQIDRALSDCLRLKRPAYIEVPANMVAESCEAESDAHGNATVSSDEGALDEAVREAAVMIRESRSPAVLVGMEVRRFKLQEQLMVLVERGGFAVATTIGGKTALTEAYEHYVGVYQGGFTDGRAHDTVEDADCLLCLGALMTDITTGGFTAHLDTNRMINANADKVRIRHHVYDKVRLGDFIARLTQAVGAAEAANHKHSKAPYRAGRAYTPRSERKLTVARFFERMNHFVTDDMTIVSDTGDVMFGATELHLSRTESFVSQDFYLSIGYALPAALGVALAAPTQRVVVFIGDGAFQMTAQELSTFNRAGVHPVIFVLNNDGYVIERLIHDGPYNELGRWEYHKLPEVLNAGVGIVARTEGELEKALDLASRKRDALVLIEIQVDRLDSTPTLSRVGESLRRLSKK